MENVLLQVLCKAFPKDNMASIFTNLVIIQMVIRLFKDTIAKVNYSICRLPKCRVCGVDTYTGCVKKKFTVGKGLLMQKVFNSLNKIL